MWLALGMAFYLAVHAWLQVMDSSVMQNDCIEAGKHVDCRLQDLMCFFLLLSAVPDEEPERPDRRHHASADADHVRRRTDHAVRMGIPSRRLTGVNDGSWRPISAQKVVLRAGRRDR